MLCSQTGGHALLEGMCWIFTSQKMINFIDEGQTTEQQLEAGTHNIATTCGV